MRKLLLASSSPYRKELLSRLQLPFSTFSPEIDETRRDNESWSDLVLRLSKEKAMVAAKHHPNTVCIGSDEIAALDDTLLGKPGTKDNAIDQLRQMSNQKVSFYTGVCVFAPHLGKDESAIVVTAVKFRTLTDSMIENYLTKEEPFGSAGSFKSESLGSALIEYFEGSDPTALIGLPLIKLCDLLHKVGIEVI